MRYLTRLDSALEMRQRPTAALLEESDPYSGWESMDYRLQDAIITINREKCPKCGNPVWLCHSTDNRIDFEPVVSICYATAEIADKQKLDGRELKPGEYYYAKPVGVENEDGSRDPLPTREEAIAKMQG